MRTFSFINHPYNLMHLRSIWPQARLIPAALIRSFSHNILPLKTAKVHIPISKASLMEGLMVGCPLLPEQIFCLGPELISHKIISIGRIAKRYGASILGLGACDAAMEAIGFTVARTLAMPVTSGNAFTAWSVFESVYRMARAKKIDLAGATVAIIGAVSSVGSLCGQKFSSSVHRIILSDARATNLENIKNKILLQHQIEVLVEPDATRAVAGADIVIVLASVDEPGILASVKPQALVCTITLSPVSQQIRPRRTDITFVQAGLVKLPFTMEAYMPQVLPQDVVTASLAETLLLTLEERFVNYSLGQEINVDKLEEIADIGAQHGFEVWVPQAPAL